MNQREGAYHSAHFIANFLHMSGQIDHIRRLVDHLSWANARLHDSIQRARTPLPPVFSLYSHVLGAEHTWLQRIANEAPSVAVWPSLSLDECETLSARNIKSLRSLVETLTPAELSRTVTYRNTSGTEFSNELHDILLHVALHGSYHRGQIAALIRSGGDEPINTDYIMWLRS